MFDAPLVSPPFTAALGQTVCRFLPAGKYRFAFWMANRGYPAFWASLPDSLGGAKFACDLRDTIARDSYFIGIYEPVETRLMQRCLKTGDTLVDVGGNWGYFTLVAGGLLRGGGRIVTFEPDPRLLPVLQGNVKQNGFHHVTVLPVAASDQEGTLEFSGFTEAGGNSGLSSAFGEKRSGDRVFTTRARPLDTVFAELEIGRAAFLKMDIEGAEGVALRGLAQSLRAGKVDRMMVELHPLHLKNGGFDAKSLVDEVVACGYTAHRIDHSWETLRKFSYDPNTPMEGALFSYQASESLDDWPHILFVRNGLPLLP